MFGRPARTNRLHKHSGAPQSDANVNSGVTSVQATCVKSVCPQCAHGASSGSKHARQMGNVGTPAKKTNTPSLVGAPHTVHHS